MLGNLEARASRAARRTAIGAAGILLLGAGLGFLTLAAWIVLVRLTDPLTAAVVLGATYGGMGLILLGIAALPAQPAATAPGVDPQSLRHSGAARANGLPAVAQAFLVGLQAGVNTDRPRH